MGNRAKLVPVSHSCLLAHQNLPSEVSNLRIYGEEEGVVYMSIETDHKLHLSRGIIRLRSDCQTWATGCQVGQTGSPGLSDGGEYE